MAEEEGANPFEGMDEVVVDGADAARAPSGTHGDGDGGNDGETKETESPYTFHAAHPCPPSHHWRSASKALPPLPAVRSKDGLTLSPLWTTTPNAALPTAVLARMKARRLILPYHLSFRRSSTGSITIFEVKPGLRMARCCSM
jgi:hypothetical protein